MRVFFDVDDTIITWDVRLRPGVKEVFARLRADGHELYLWSGNGRRWEIVRRFDLHEHVLDCFWKPLYRHHERLAELGVPFAPDFVIDDHQEVVDRLPRRAHRAARPPAGAGPRAVARLRGHPRVRGVRGGSAAGTLAPPR